MLNLCLPSCHFKTHKLHLYTCEWQVVIYNSYKFIYINIDTQMSQPLIADWQNPEIYIQNILHPWKTIFHNIFFKFNSLEFVVSI